MNVMQGADVAPTQNQRNQVAAARAAGAPALAAWTALKTEMAALNLKLKAAGLAPLTISH
jgi:hypothetical protein